MGGNKMKEPDPSQWKQKFYFSLTQSQQVIYREGRRYVNFENIKRKQKKYIALH